MNIHTADPERRPLMPYRYARQNAVALTWDDQGQGMILARADAAVRAIIEARRIAACRVGCTTVTPEQFENALSEIYARAGMQAADSIAPTAHLEQLAQTADLLDVSDDAPVIALINGIIGQAVQMLASDVHLEPMADQVRVRFRIDGRMEHIAFLPVSLLPTLVSRIKVMSQLDIAEKRVPQDGRVSLTLGGRALDVRVSTLPARHGERAVLRLLQQDGARLDIDSLGMPQAVRDGYRRALQTPHGIVLVAGPTGSGKTTTLYAGLAELHDDTRTILTVEDPVEYALDGIGQTHIRPQAGLTFASGLRAILRQDPDVVMVGEIRDTETARIAIQAGLTGHLVLSTVHTNSAAAAITRLIDMGIEPFLIASTLLAVISQRLPQRLCRHCREQSVASDAECAMLGIESPVRLWRANGCARCRGRGTSGRTGAYEMMTVTADIAGKIHASARESDIHRAAVGEGASLSDHARALVLSGDIPISEMARVVRQ